MSGTLYVKIVVVKKRKHTNHTNHKPHTHTHTNKHTCTHGDNKQANNYTKSNTIINHMMSVSSFSSANAEVLLQSNPI